MPGVSSAPLALQLLYSLEFFDISFVLQTIGSFCSHQRIDINVWDLYALDYVALDAG
jgi:hypothetical protein